MGFKSNVNEKENKIVQIKQCNVVVQDANPPIMMDIQASSEKSKASVFSLCLRHRVFATEPERLKCSRKMSMHFEKTHWH